MSATTEVKPRPLSGDRVLIAQIMGIGNVLRRVVEYGERKVVVTLDGGGVVTVREGAVKIVDPLPTPWSSRRR